MARLYAILTFLIVTILLFNAAGIVTGTGYLLNNLGITEPENFGSSQFYLTLGALFALSLAGVAIGILFARDSNSVVMLLSGSTFVPVLLLIGWDIIVIFQKLALTNRFIAVILFAPMLVCYFISVFDWWRSFAS